MYCEWVHYTQKCFEIRSTLNEITSKYNVMLSFVERRKQEYSGKSLREQLNANEQHPCNNLFWDQTQGVEDESCTPTLLYKIVPTQMQTVFSCFKVNTLYISSRIKSVFFLHQPDNLQAFPIHEQ